MVSSVLVPVQERGQKALERLGLPTRRQEAWRLTNLKRLEAVHDLPVVHARTPGRLPDSPPQGLRLILGSDKDPLADVDLPAGITPLAGDSLTRALDCAVDHCSCAQDWPVELNRAHSQQLLALKISGKVPPLELVIAADGGGLLATRVLLVLEKSAELEMLQVIQADQGSAHSHLCEVHLAEGAQLRHGLLALGDGSGSLLATLATQQEPGSHYHFSSFVHGWMLGRIEPRIVQLNGQASTTLKGLAVTADDQQVGVHSFMRFDGPEGELDQLQKAVAAERSHSIFNGAIQVPRAAQRTNASQLSRSLLLSGRARVDAKPELEIVADDVRCAHGATVSQLQQEQLFYLRSRGVAADAAAALLLKGYCSEVMDRLPAAAAAWTASGVITDPARPL